MRWAWMLWLLLLCAGGCTMTSSARVEMRPSDLDSTLLVLEAKLSG